MRKQKDSVNHLGICGDEAFSLFLSCKSSCRYIMQVRLKLSKPELFLFPIARAYINGRELVNQPVQAKYGAYWSLCHCDLFYTTFCWPFIVEKHILPVKFTI